MISGAHDWICPPVFGEEIHRLIPGSRYVLFGESSHSLRVDEPERLFAEILIRNPEYKQYTPDEDPYFKMFAL